MAMTTHLRPGEATPEKAPSVFTSSLSRRIFDASARIDKGNALKWKFHVSFRWSAMSRESRDKFIKSRTKVAAEMYFFYCASIHLMLQFMQSTISYDMLRCRDT